MGRVVTIENFLKTAKQTWKSLEISSGVTDFASKEEIGKHVSALTPSYKRLVAEQLMA